MPFCASSRLRINPLDFSVLAQSAIFSHSSFDGAFFVNIQSWRLLRLFSAILPDATSEEDLQWETAIDDCYRSAGLMGEDIYEPGSPGQLRPMPTLQNVLWTIENNCGRDSRLYTALQAFIRGPGICFSGLTNIDLHNPYTVLDVSALPADLRYIGAEIAINYAMDAAVYHQSMLITIDNLHTLDGTPITSRLLNLLQGKPNLTNKSNVSIVMTTGHIGVKEQSASSTCVITRDIARHITQFLFMGQVSQNFSNGHSTEAGEESFWQTIGVQYPTPDLWLKLERQQRNTAFCTHEGKLSHQIRFEAADLFKLIIGMDDMSPDSEREKIRENTSKAMSQAKSIAAICGDILNQTCTLIRYKFQTRKWKRRQQDHKLLKIASEKLESAKKAKREEWKI